MRVKRLEILGFKSFKDKTVVHFDQGITGIVGPNGCGKSNIVDAFFWVMGEQSYKHMRGKNSSDLIFNGSSKYAPLGMAEATLVLETDVPDIAHAPSGATARNIPVHLRSKEIAVTRRVYRGGEGEYLINGAPGRLKEIQELFMDTGVGAKGYSVIEQGQIDKIVNAKPEDRRLLIEEAAGIAKYKARKIESLRKMEAATGNLARLADLIQEILRNRDSLERQAQKARKYKEYKEALTEKELFWARRKRSLVRSHIAEIDQNRAGLETALMGFRAGIQTAENAIEVERGRQLAASTDAEAIQQQIQSESELLASERSALELSRQRQEDLTRQMRVMSQEKTDLIAVIALERERIEGIEKNSAELVNKSKTEKKRAFELESELNNIRSETLIVKKRHAELQIKRVATLNEATGSKSRLAALEARIEAVCATQQRVESELASMESKAHSTQEKLDELAIRSQNLRLSREMSVSALESLESRAQAALHEIDGLKTERESLIHRIAERSSRTESLQALVNAFEGIGSGPKALLASNNQSYLLLADLIEVDSGFEAAIEGLLEGLLESVIGGSVSQAVLDIATLRQENGGRAGTLLYSPLIESTSGAPHSQIQLEAFGFEVLAQAFEKVRIREGHRQATSLVSQELSRAFIVRTLAPLAQAPKKFFEQLGGLALVSLDGDVLDRRGILRGGCTGAEEDLGLLRRRRELRELTADLETLKSRKSLVEAAISKRLTERTEIEIELRETQVSLQEVLRALAAAERDLELLQSSRTDQRETIEQLTKQIQENHRDQEQAVTERLTVLTEINQYGTRVSEIEREINESGQIAGERDEELRALEETLQRVKIEEAAVSQRAESLLREAIAARALIGSREKRLADIEAWLQGAAHDLTSFQAGETSRINKVESITKILGGRQEELSLTKDRIERSSIEIQAAMDRIKILRTELDEGSSRQSQLMIDAERLQSEINFLLQNIEEKYGKDCMDSTDLAPIQEEMPDPIVTQAMTAEDEKILFEEVEKIRERMRRLGEVNMMALEEYEEVRKRYEHLEHERQDLVQSIDDLKDAITQINQTSEVRFKKAFEAIAERFERLFPIVFGGGQASLSLIYAEGSTDILEAGVDIMAQPPGKKIANISVLSGGEKALIAVSLIFAVFMVKPSPFCLLDEVDAPLDDSNVGRFNALLREMSKKSQFILITHNKKTMELNDTLYGVTMEEPGVSKVISVRVMENEARAVM